MAKLEAQSYPLRLIAEQFSERSEDMIQVLNKYTSQFTQLTEGAGGWKGQGAQAYVRQSELLIHEMQKTIRAFDATSNTLFQLASYVDEIHTMKQQLAQLNERIRWLIHCKHGHFESNPYQNELDAVRLQVEKLEIKIAQDSLEFDREVAQQLFDIARTAPFAGQLLQQMKQATLIYGPTLEPMFVPILVTPDPGNRTGRVRVDYLNDVILMNRIVFEYYETHPYATGPDGESAAKMRELALSAQNEARKDGGTVGVPIVFMHGLEGNVTTFQTMVDQYGGYSKIYTFHRDGSISCEDGPNLDADQPLIQYVFEDAAMHFDRQTDTFTQISDRMKSDLQASYFMVASHSMGGVVTTKYIEDTGGNDILRFATLGSPILGSGVDRNANDALKKLLFFPFNEDFWLLEKEKLPAVLDLETGSDANKEIYDNRKKFNQNIEVFSGAGLGEKDQGDGVVMPNSAYGLKSFANPVKFHNKLYPSEGHSDLHEKQPEIEDVMNFLKYGEIPHENN